MNPIVTKQTTGDETRIIINLSEDESEIVGMTLCGSNDDAAKELGEEIAAALDEVNR